MCSVSARSAPDAERGRAAVGLLLPAALADAAGGQRRLSVPLGAAGGGDGAPGAAGSTTVSAVLAALRGQQPGLYSRLCDETGEIRRYVNLYLDGEDIRDLAGRSTVLPAGAELLVLQSIAGG